MMGNAYGQGMMGYPGSGYGPGMMSGSGDDEWLQRLRTIRVLTEVVIGRSERCP